MFRWHRKNVAIPTGKCDNNSRKFDSFAINPCVEFTFRKGYIYIQALTRGDCNVTLKFPGLFLLFLVGCVLFMLSNYTFSRFGLREKHLTLICFVGSSCFFILVYETISISDDVRVV